MGIAQDSRSLVSTLNHHSFIALIIFIPINMPRNGKDHSGENSVQQTPRRSARLGLTRIRASSSFNDTSTPRRHSTCTKSDGNTVASPRTGGPPAATQATSSDAVDYGKTPQHVKDLADKLGLPGLKSVVPYGRRRDDHSCCVCERTSPYGYKEL